MNKEDLMVIYQNENGSLNIKVDTKGNTVWASQAQISQIFGRDQSVISKHLKYLFDNEEIDKKSNMQKMHIANSDKMVTFYSLDVVLSVGYRVKSKNAIKFRKWANSVLNKYIMNGWAVNENKIKENYEKFIEVIDNIKCLLPSESIVSNDNVLDLIKTYANTWFSLDAYDKDNLFKKGKTEKNIDLNVNELNNAIKQLREDLIKKGEASELFARERESNAIENIFCNVMQSFEGVDLYKTVEEKAAHLLYFIVKNHSLVDGNKRTGAYSFIWFLHKNEILNLNKITPETLTTLTLLVAESNPKEKEKMISLILQLLK